MCIFTNLKYIITVCYDDIILYNVLPMHSFFFPLVYKSRITFNTTSKITKEPKQNSRLGTASNKIIAAGWGGFSLVCGRPTLALSSALVHQKNKYNGSITLPKQDQTIQKH